MSKWTGTVFFNGNEWQLFQVCQLCQGTGFFQPATNVYNAPTDVNCKNKNCDQGMVRSGFETAAELKDFVNRLPDDG